MDVNNVFVSASNLGFNPYTYIEKVNPAFVQEIHLAGHRIENIGMATLRIDDHGSTVSPEVWSLYAHTLNHVGITPTLIEWDNNIPPLDQLINQALTANTFLQKISHG